MRGSVYFTVFCESCHIYSSLPLSFSVSATITVASRRTTIIILSYLVKMLRRASLSRISHAWFAVKDFCWDCPPPLPLRPKESRGIRNEVSSKQTRWGRKRNDIATFQVLKLSDRTSREIPLLIMSFAVGTLLTSQIPCRLIVC